jgi:alpha-tubulin suppressor-like RCC1 family protein
MLLGFVFGCGGGAESPRESSGSAGQGASGAGDGSGGGEGGAGGEAGSAGTGGAAGAGGGTVEPQAQISAGGDFNLLLRADGKLWAWGFNGEGQLGYGVTTQAGGPIEVELPNLRSVHAGDRFSLAVTKGGTVWSWGSNVVGQLGDGTTMARATPAAIPGLVGVQSAAGGRLHSLVLKEDGTVWAFGLNDSGQLGNGSLVEYSPVPVQVSDLMGIRAVAAGSNFSLALRKDGKVLAWGSNSKGQLGLPGIAAANEPVEIPTLSSIVAISARRTNAMALDETGKVWTWGEIPEVSPMGTELVPPSPLAEGADTAAIAAGQLHSLLLKKNGTVFAYGNNSEGQLGDGKTDDTLQLVQTSTLKDIVAIGGGNYHSIALDGQGKVYCWGANGTNQLGTGTPVEQSSEPIPVEIPSP